MMDGCSLDKGWVSGSVKLGAVRLYFTFFSSLFCVIVVLGV